ncbi:MAG: dihydroorotate dehydrogenase electron transfer subunit [Treponema sp.]|jgi:NAD(P)H-flavin reductase|nr:dihydroorotate dehydrogenase electron transfer subunit [Treponema sp.]
MCVNSAKSLTCELTGNTKINDEIFTHTFEWKGPSPRAGQFFMVKPLRCSFFLPRPLAVMGYSDTSHTVKFLIARRGKGTGELAKMRIGEEAELTGPLGNAWTDFLPEGRKAALISGSAGVAPLAALVSERQNYDFYFYAGFGNGFRNKREEAAVLDAAVNAKKLITAAEDGVNAPRGRIVDFFERGDTDIVFACGSLPMLKAVKEKCIKFSLPCFLSLENRMACGTGACLGCTIRTVNGNRRVCADGPIFPAEEILFDE